MTPGIPGVDARDQPLGAGGDVADDEFRWPKDRPREHAAPLPATKPPLPAGTYLRWAVAALGLTAGVTFALSPSPAGLSPEGQAACAVFLICTTLWISEVVPVGVTGLLGVALLGLTGAMETSQAYAAFGNSAVFFILGVFILAAATIHSGLSKRLALFFLRRFQRSEQTLATGIMITAAFMTVWMPAQATAAMLFPIALELTRSMGLRPHESSYAKVLFLSLAWGAMVGSNASFLGSTRAPLALGILQKTAGVSVTFGQWFLAAAPIVGLGLVIGLLVLRLGFRRERVDLAAAKQMMDASVAELGPIGPHQMRIAGTVLLTIGSWVFLGGEVDLAALALLGSVVLFAIGALRWSDLDGYVHWGIVLMYGGAIALGNAVEGSGAAEWLVTGLIDGVTISPTAALIGLALLSVLLTEFMSNAAAVAVMLPLGLSLSGHLGLSPVVIMLTCSLAAGLDFTFPFSSAPNTIVYASGYLRMRDMLVVGTVMTVLQILLLVLVSWLYWPMIGLL